MPAKYKFAPGGYDVEVYRRDDILKTIDDNILDKEVAMEIINQCEQDAIDFITQGKWTGIPFIGNVRIPKIKLLADDPEQKALLEEAKATLDKERYVMFKQRLNKANAESIRRERYFNYIVSIAISECRQAYRAYCNKSGENYAKLMMFLGKNATRIYGDEEQIKY